MYHARAFFTKYYIRDLLLRIQNLETRLANAEDAAAFYQRIDGQRARFWPDKQKTIEKLEKENAKLKAAYDKISEVCDYFQASAEVSIEIITGLDAYREELERVPDLLMEVTPAVERIREILGMDKLDNR